jgi:hypothetical protein
MQSELAIYSRVTGHDICRDLNPGVKSHCQDQVKAGFHEKEMYDLSGSIWREDGM